MNPISTFFGRSLPRLVLVLCTAMGRLAAEDTADRAQISAALAPEGGHITVEAHGVRPSLPGLFTAAVQQSTAVTATEVTSEAKVSLHVLQGNPEVFSLGLVGEGEVVAVTGSGLRDWSVRQDADARRYIDLRPVRSTGSPSARDFEFLVQLRRGDVKVPDRVAMPTVVAGEAAGYDWHGRFEPDSAVSLEVKQATGVVAAQVGDDDERVLEYVAQGQPGIVLAVLPRGAASAEAALSNARLTGVVDEGAKTVEFKLHAQATSAKPGARLRLLGGGAGLVGETSGDGWHAEVASDAGYELVLERKGTFPIDLAFSAAIRVQDDWRRLGFELAAGSVVPVFLSGLPDAVEFDRAAAVVLDPTKGGWQGYLPADGNTTLSWKRMRQNTEGTLFFTSAEQTEIRVGAGVLRQVSRLTFRVMQGKLQSVRLRVDGPGEIVGVDGSNVVGWNVVTSDKGRAIDVKLSRPFESDGTLVVQSQSVLGTFPVRVEPLRLSPEGGVRHSGFIRVANAGAVRLELADVDGMMQLAPSQFPGQPLEAGTRQVFVYRFPTAARQFTVLASQILPEVGVSQVTTYSVGETDRIVESDLELDVREAALRDWSLTIPSDYAVVSVQGAAVSDYTVESGPASTTPAANTPGRQLKVFFAQPVLGRQLIQLRLEKSQAAAAGEWTLPPLQFPGAKSVRGHIGVIAAPGFRLRPGSIDALAEVPLSFFPKQAAGLQQAYRLRDVAWTAAMRIEALGQSVQADVFHLYSLKEGAVSASVLINYFVVGAPANEWRIAVPTEAGNIDVTGQGVRREWRREGNVIVVTLHQPVLGAATLLITFEQPMSARGGTIRPGEVEPLGVHSERGYVQVVSPLQVRTTIDQATGNLLKLEPLELPTELRLFTTAPALAVYQYTARPFELAVGVQWYQPGDTVDQVIDFAKLNSQIARDGQVVTDVQLFVKTRGRKLLRFQLPPQVKLWETRVDDELVTARSDGDWTVVPLTARLNPNEPVRVALRLGQPAAAGSRNITLTAPKMAMPMVVGDWTLQADRGRLLVPAGGTAEPTMPNLTETGFEWILAHAQIAIVLLLIAGGLGAWMARMRTGLGAFYALLAGGFALLVAISLVSDAAVNRHINVTKVVYAATVLPTDGPMVLRVGNVPAWQAMISGWGVAAILAGVACGFVDVRRRRGGNDSRGALAALAVMLVGVGLLAQRGGAVWFLIAVATAILSFVLVPGARNAWYAWVHRRRSSEPSGPAAGSSTVVSAIAVGLIGAGSLMHGNMVRAANATDWAGASGSAQAIVQRWDIHDNRLFGEIDLTVRGAAGDSFLLLNAPAVLTDFAGSGLRVTNVAREGGAAYFVSVLAPSSDAKAPLAARAGTYTAHAKFELPVPDLTKGVPLLTGAAAVQRVTVQLDQPGWDFSSPRAVAVMPTPGLPATRSGATLVLALDGAPVVALVPQSRNVDAEAVRFFAETANLFMPGPGVVNAYAQLAIRPVQGRVASIDVAVPEGFSIGDVGNGPVGRWRFDPEKHLLQVGIEPAQEAAFRFVVQMQQAASALPFNLSLHPVRVLGAEGDVGAIGLAFAGDAQPEQVVTSAVSTVSTDDFDRNLLPKGREGAPLATLLSAYRYSGSDAMVSLRVAPVAPEVRVATRELVSLGDDRVVVAADLNVAITRVGLFQLSFALPAGMELEAATGPALSHWTEAEEKGARVVTLHLSGRTLGEQAFALTLSGPAATATSAWNVPRVTLREATRQTGELQVVPDRGMQLRAVGRQNVSELDPRSVGNARPGALAFRILEADWAVSLGIEMLNPWVTVQALKEVTAREGQTLTRIAMQYHVENAAVKQLRVSLPGITDDQAKTLHATGPAVSDFVPVPGGAGQWMIRFQHGIVGDTTVQIEYQGSPAGGDGTQAIATPEFEGARQVVQFVAVRGGGRLEIDAPTLPRGWQRVDWSAVPAVLQDRTDRSVPALTLRVAEPERPLSVVVRRHAVADALKLRVTGGQLMTIFSPAGPSLTSVDLRIEVAEKSTLRVRLPEQARLFNTIVNGESVAAVREGDAYLFHVSANTTADPTAAVRLVYSVDGLAASRISLVGPRFNVPLENVTWRVVVPPGYELSRYRGELQLRQEGEGGWFGVKDYESSIASKRLAEARQGTEFLQAASVFLQKGQQQQAGEVLMRAAKASSLDEASNEDARVQLRALRTDQTMLGLNTRRQRLYLDNSAEAMRNEQLEQAANLNPLMRGKIDFDPQQLDQMLMGNTVEENAALRGIAGRIVDQQLAAEPAPRAIDVTLPERGRVYTFVRSLQVNGDSPLELTVSIVRAQNSGVWFGIVLLAGIGVVTAFLTRKKTT